MKRALILFAFLSPTAALADVVVLSDGQQIKGAVTEESDQVTVRLDVGSVSFPRSEVKEIRREATPIHELEQKRAKLDGNDAAGRSALARWAEQQGLDDSARDLYRELLALRPDDPTARQRLGYRKHEGRWMTEEEHLAATGHVLYGGKWVTKEESERLEKEATERRVRRLEEQVALQQKKIEEIKEEPKPEPEPAYSTSSFIYDGWWSYGWWPYNPPFIYGDFLPRTKFHHKQPVIRPAQPGLRGKLRTQRGPSSVGRAAPLQRP